MSSEPRPRRRTPHAPVAVALLVAVVAVVLAVLWVVGRQSPPGIYSGGWWSEDMESVEVRGLAESHRLFRCEAGRIETRMDLSRGSGPATPTLVSISVPVLDEVLAAPDATTRVRTDVMRDPSGDLDDLVPLERHSFSGGSAREARTVLVWEIAECPQIQGYITVDTVDVTYTVFGMSHTTSLDLVVPLALTTLDLDDTRREYGVVD